MAVKRLASSKITRVWVIAVAGGEVIGTILQESRFDGTESTGRVKASKHVGGLLREKTWPAGSIANVNKAREWKHF